MKRELFNKWTAALRSGNYKQGTGTLRTEDDHFCCLGVLCEISPNVERFTDSSGNRGYMHEGSFYRRSLEPLYIGNSAHRLRNDLGLGAPSREGGEMLSIHGALMNYNDTQGYTFAEIAYKLDDYVAHGVLKLVD